VGGVWLGHDSCRQPQTYVKPEAAITVFELLMMSSVSLKKCRAIKKHWNNKFYYTVASCWLFLYDFYSRHLDTPEIQHPICDILHTTYLNIDADRVRGTASIPAVITFVNVVTLLPVTVRLLQPNPFHSCTACVPRRARVTTKSWIQVRASNPRITRLC